MSSTRRCGIQTDLALNNTILAKLERRDVSRQVEAVCTGRGEEIPARVGQRTDIRAVLRPAVGDTRRDQREVAVGVHGQVGGRVDAVLAQAVAVLHEGVEVLARGVHGHPAGVVALIRTVDTADKLDLGGVGARLPVDPELVGLEVGGVEVRLRGVEDHAVDARVVLVRIVLDVFLEGAA